MSLDRQTISAGLERLERALLEIVEEMAELRGQLENPQPVIRPEDWLTTAVLAERFTLSHSQIRRYLQRALDREAPGIRKLADDTWLATAKAVQAEIERK